jgi:hypothetical protein
MTRIPFAVAIIFAALTTEAVHADSIPNLTGVPLSYTSGSPFTFEISVPATLSQPPPRGPELGYAVISFNVVLDITTTVANPTISATFGMPSSGYIFPGSTSFTGSVNGTNTNDLVVQFTDTTTVPALTADGNLILGEVTVTAGDDATIGIAFAKETTVQTTITQEYLNATYPLGASASVVQGQGPPASVPTPAGWATFATGAIILLGRNRLRLFTPRGQE